MVDVIQGDRMIDVFSERRYLRNHGEQCLYCESYALQKITEEYGKEFIYVGMSCNSCLKEWTDVFKVSGERPEKCWKCGSLDFIEGDFEMDGNEGKVDVECENCEGFWCLKYVLADVDESYCLKN